MKTGAIVLAAGGSSRMGHPKQLLELDGEPLIRRAARVTRSIVSGPIVIVLGASAEESTAALEPLGGFRIVVADGWQEGPGASVKAGLTALLADELDRVLIVLADQPLIESHHLQHVLAAGPFSAAQFDDGQLGAPAVFPREVFPELLALPAAHGARSVLTTWAAKVRPVPMSEAGVDVDTPADWARVREQARNTLECPTPFR